MLDAVSSNKLCHENCLCSIYSQTEHTGRGLAIYSVVLFGFFPLPINYCNSFPTLLLVFPLCEEHDRTGCLYRLKAKGEDANEMTPFSFYALHQINPAVCIVPITKHLYT